MQTLDDEDFNNHNDIVKIATSVQSLYEKTYQSFKNISDQLKSFKCASENELTEIFYSLQRDKMMNKLCQFSRFNSFTI